MKQTIKLTESKLREMIVNAINESMEEGENEGFLNNLKKGFQAGKNAPVNYHADPNAKDALSQGINNVGQRIDNFKQGFNLQKQYSKMDKLKQELQQLVDSGVITPRQTVGQLLQANVGTKQNKNLGQGAKGFGGAKSDYQRQAKNMGIRLSETIDKVINEFLNEQNKKEA